MPLTAGARSGSTARAPTSASRNREQRLLAKYHAGDLVAREELIHRLLPLAKSLAARYRHTAESQEDLEQVASLGLIKAVDRYDPELGSLVSYAIPTVIGELRRHFRDTGWGMRVPRSIQERLLHVNNAVDELSGELGRSPTPTDVAGHTGLSVEEVLEALEASVAYSPVPLDAPHCSAEDGERTLGEGLGADDPGYALVGVRQAMAPAFRALPVREKVVLKLRLIDDLKQAEIAEQLGISQMHVSRLLRRSLDRLAAAAERHGEPSA